jgi:hypothetical protein
MIHFSEQESKLEVVFYDEELPIKKQKRCTVKNYSILTLMLRGQRYELYFIKLSNYQ